MNNRPYGGVKRDRQKDRPCPDGYPNATSDQDDTMRA